MQVSMLRTVCTAKEFARTFIKAWRALGYDAAPTQEQVGVIYAQWMTETGGAACWNWNIGNVKVSQGEVNAGVPWIDLPGTTEYIAGERKKLPEGDPGRRFRAFFSLDEGMAEHVAFLRNRRFKHCWPFVEAGDPVGFTHAIKAGADGKEGTNDDYFTAPIGMYVRAMQDHFVRWMNAAAYHDAVKELEELAEAPTLTDLEPVTQPAPVVDFEIVHPLTYDLTRDPDSEPGA